MELRLQGKLPERRSNHCSFVQCIDGQEFLYIHGGRDLKEGPIDSMWRLNLSALQNLHQDPFCQVSWEPITPKGTGPGKISHHTAASNEDCAIIYGGLKGEDSCKDVYCYKFATNTWSCC